MKAYKAVAVINELHRIFLVQDPDTGKIYVKKILDVYNEEVYRQLFEADIVGVPHILEYEILNGKLVLIEEYISGKTLREKIDSMELTLQNIKSYLVKLCDVLEKLHAMTPPIIHRDIKPSNIIITSYGYPVLIDFNAAKHFRCDAESDTVLLGTPGYAAPEQFGFGASSPRTDIYALGVLIKEMIRPWEEYSYLFAPIIEKCTQLDPTGRYQSISELRYAVLGLDGPDESAGDIAAGSSESCGLRAGSSADRKRDLTPPGYRSRTPWKMVMGSLGYLLCIWLAGSIQIEGAVGGRLWLERGAFLGMMLMMIFIGCDYLNIRDFVPLCRNKNRFLRWLGIFIFDLFVVSAIFLVFTLIEMFVR